MSTLGMAIAKVDAEIRQAEDTVARLWRIREALERANCGDDQRHTGWRDRAGMLRGLTPAKIDLAAAVAERRS